MYGNMILLLNVQIFVAAEKCTVAFY